MTDARKAADLEAARARNGVPADGLSDEQWEAGAGAKPAPSEYEKLCAWFLAPPMAGKVSTSRGIDGLHCTMMIGGDLAFFNAETAAEIIANVDARRELTAEHNATQAKRKYMSWGDAGGPEECSHGYAAGIPCPRCDEEPGSCAVMMAFATALEPEQRARVHWESSGSRADYMRVSVDGATVYQHGHNAAPNVDSMLDALKAALAKPAPQAEPLRECVEDIEAERDELRDQLAAVTAEHDAMAERYRINLADALGVSRTWQLSDLLIEARAVKANRVALTERLARRSRLESVAREALETFGNVRQTLKAIEECAKFIVAAHHYGDAKITLEEYADEVAGVAITNAQIMLLLGDEHGPPAFERQLAKLEAAIATARTPAR